MGSHSAASNDARRKFHTARRFTVAIVAATESHTDPTWLAKADRSAVAADWENRLTPVLERLEREELRTVR